MQYLVNSDGQRTEMKRHNFKSLKTCQTVDRVNITAVCAN